MKHGPKSFGTRQHAAKMLSGEKGKSYVVRDGTIGKSIAEFLYAVYSDQSTICNSLAAICNANFDWLFQPIKC